MRRSMAACCSWKLSAKSEFLLVGIEWERGWRYRIEKEANGTWLSVDVADLTYDMAPGERLPAPRIFLGACPTATSNRHSSRTALHATECLPCAFQNSPWIVYDFWATEAEGVQEAAFTKWSSLPSLGVDVFNMDASWYMDSSKKGTGDWGCGLGHYADDRRSILWDSPAFRIVCTKRG